MNALLMVFDSPSNTTLTKMSTNVYLKMERKSISYADKGNAINNIHHFLISKDCQAHMNSYCKRKADEVFSIIYLRIPYFLDRIRS